MNEEKSGGLTGLVIFIMVVAVFAVVTYLLYVYTTQKSVEAGVAAVAIALGAWYISYRLAYPHHR